jgi:hypothetical protein
MRAPRASVLAALCLLLLVAGVWAAALPARGQLGAVLADRDGWWARAKGGDLPLTSPSLAFVVPDKAIAVAASNGEPEKSAAVGVVLDVDPARFERLILNLREVADQGANFGVVSNPAGGTAGGAVDACLITANWATTKNGTWPTRPAYDVASCAPGARSSDGVWSFDLSTFARRWLAGEVPQNGVALIEHVDAPVTFQVAWGDRTTSDITFSLDLTTEDEPVFAPIDTPDDSAPAASDSGDTSTFDTVPSQPSTSSYEFNASDSYTTPVPKAAAPAVKTTTPARTTPATRTAQPIAARPPKVTAGIPLAVLLLLPLGLLVAFAASYALGPAGDPAGTLLTRREGGVSRALARRRPLEDRP